MNAPNPQTITRLLQSARAGDTGAAKALLPLVYAELHGLANGIFSKERNGHTLQPTALIHEAWMKLAGRIDLLEDRHHFFVVASRAMRQVLADHARRVSRLKRGDGRKKVTLDEALGAPRVNGIDLVDLEDSLSRLSSLNARHAQVVELRMFGGLTIAETADALEVSHTTVEADWFTARAWLRNELGRGR